MSEALPCEIVQGEEGRPVSDEAVTPEVRPEPTGASHEVAPTEMFFSTTDERGVITDANSVFVRLSRYPLQELLNAPHSIIRHPDMPGGAFEAMWQTLAAGDPFCAYVDNLAADGSRYTVFATVTPLAKDGGYLSVRTRPLCLDLLDTVRGMYQVARPKERAAREGGASAHEAAVLGLDDLATQIQDAGIGTYLDVMHLVLPAEIEARRAAGVGIPRRPDAEGSVGRILGSATELSDALDGWSERQQDLAAVADDLVTAQGELDDSMDKALDAANRFKDALAAQEGFSPALMTIDLWARMMGVIVEVGDDLAEDLATLRNSCRSTRFRVSLAQLQNEAVGQFAAEISDGGLEPALALRAGSSIVMLCRAMSEGFELTRDEMFRNADLAQKTVELIDNASGLIAMPTELIENWRDQVAGRDDAAISALIPQVEEQIRAARESLDMLERLGGRCAGLAQPYDTSAADDALEAIRHQADDLVADEGR
jgi:aerotaxis receptor